MSVASGHPKKFPAAAYVIRIGELHKAGEIHASSKNIVVGSRKFNATQNFKTYLLTGMMIWELVEASD